MATSQHGAYGPSAGLRLCSDRIYQDIHPSTAACDWLCPASPSAISHHKGYISPFGCCSDRCSKYAVLDAIHRPTVPLHLAYRHLQVISGTLLRGVVIVLEAPDSTRKQLEQAHEAFVVSTSRTSTERNVLRSENGVVVRATHGSLVPWPYH